MCTPRLPVVFIFVLAFASMLMNLAQPLVSRYIIDGILLQNTLPLPVKSSRLVLVVGVMIAVLSAVVALDALRGRLVSRLNARLAFSAKRRIFRHALRMPLHRLGELKVGGVTSLINWDAAAFGNLFEWGMLIPVVESVRVLLTLAVIFTLNWRLSLLGLVALPVMALLSVTLVKCLRPIYHAVHAENAAINGRVAEVAGGIRIVRTYGREAVEELRFLVNNHFVIRTSLFADLRQCVVESGWVIIISMSLFLCIAIGSLLVLRGLASVGDLTALSMYIPLTLSPVHRLVSSQNQLQSSLAAAERVLRTLDIPLDPAGSDGGLTAPERIQSIEFCGVSFGYAPGRLVLKDVEFRVPAGQVVALVGRSGSGKTTMTNLLARFHEPTAGTIRVDGRDIRDYSLRSYRRRLSIVEQDVFLFDGTVRENILIGNRAADDAAVVRAARLANADEFIRQLPDGYDTRVGERAYTLSGGQRQRLSIARAFLADSQILVLDEATSNLDSESEQKIQAALAELMKGRTTFVIAHRLSTIAGANLILVMEDGVVHERGTYRELLAARGRFWQLVGNQVANGAAPPRSPRAAADGSDGARATARVTV